MSTEPGGVMFGCQRFSLAALSLSFPYSFIRVIHDNAEENHSEHREWMQQKREYHVPARGFEFYL